VKTKSQEVFGAIDSQISGSIDVATMPPVTLQDSQKDVKDVHASPLKMVVADVVGDNLMKGESMFGNIRGTAVNAAASAVSVAGHPYIGVALKGGNAMLDRATAKKNTSEGGEASE
jgi:hypothetical protein